MSCREYKAELIEAARTGGGLAARRHAEGCHDCAMFLEQQKHLTTLEHELSVEIAPPPSLEFQLMEVYVGSRLRPRRRASARRGAWIAAGALAASLAVAWFVKPRPTPASLVSLTEAPVAKIVVATNETPKPKIQKRRHEPDTDPFLPIPYTQPLQPGERAEVVRMEMPVAALIAAGFPLATSDAGAEASADVMIGEDGRARAVRLISISERSIER